MKQALSELSRIYHPYTSWEDYKRGMWRSVGAQERKDFLSKAITFTGNAVLYGEWMRRVTEEWPIACEQNLTNTDINRKAWIGHAACCMAIHCPEDITRAAWAFLSKRQQDDANEQAQQAIDLWIQRHEEKNKQLCFFMEEAWLP